MTATALLVTLSAGSAALAIWCYVRWPKLAPRTVARAVVLCIISIGCLQVALIGLDVGADTSARLAVLALLGLVVPALTYAFLASLWVLRLFAAALRGD